MSSKDPTPIISEPFDLNAGSSPITADSGTTGTNAAAGNNINFNNNSNYNPFMTQNQNYMNNNQNMYLASLEMRQRLLRDRNAFIQKRLRENFPTKFFFLHIFGVILICIVAIVFQSLQFVYKTSLYYVSSGYWVSAIFILFLIIGAFFFVKRTNFLLQMFSITRIISSFVGVLGLSFINIIALTSCYGNKNNCSSYIYLNAVMVALGFANLIWMMIYIIVFQCCLFQSFVRPRPMMQNNNNLINTM